MLNSLYRANLVK